jgi:hypothetical protein
MNDLDSTPTARRKAGRRPATTTTLGAAAAALLVVAVTACRPDGERGQTELPAPITSTVPVPSAEATTSTAAVEPNVAAWCDTQAQGLISVVFPESEAEVYTYSDALRDVLGEPPPAFPAGATQPVTAADPQWTLHDAGTLDAAADLALELLGHVDTMMRNTHLDVSQEIAVQVEEVIRHRLAAIAVAGEPCAMFGPADVAASRLEIPLLGSTQIGSGFGTVWIARQYGGRGDALFNDIVRLAPDTGEIVAIVEVGNKYDGAWSTEAMRPANGLMWVQTPDTVIAIDPDTNKVASTINKVDVGPTANRAWAVDGALWICDGERLHRYNPATSQPVTVIELDFECGQISGTDDLVVASTYNEDSGESGTSAAALIDPATNTVLHAVALPIDGLVPVVLDDKVFLSGNGSTRAVTIDRATGAVAEAPSLSARVSDSQPAFDGEFIYLPAKDTDGIIAVNAETLEVSEVIQTLGVNSIVVHDGELWTANNVSGFVQAFTR